MRRIYFAGAIFATVALGLAPSANAQSARARVERSHNTYHVQACPGPAAFGQARCFAHIVTDRAGNFLMNRRRNGSISATSNATPSGYGPVDLRSAYKITGSGSASTTIAIVDAYGYKNAESDLQVYRSQYGLPTCTTANGCFHKYDQNGGSKYPRNDTGWSQETALDLDMASAICPNCHIILVEANTSSYSNLATAENTAAALGAHVISNSYGGGESGTTPYASAYNHPGIAITVSSGDSGYGVQFPASSPNVTAVGGTSLYHAAGTSRGWTESVWSGAGSGCSSVYAKPSWQSDPLCGSRTVADVSAIADPSTGVAVYGPANAHSSAWLVFGGTSVAAPLIGGVYGVNGGAVNYGSDPYAHTGSLFDVTSGSNGSCGGTYLCTGVVGYDGPSGLGTPDGTAAF